MPYKTIIRLSGVARNPANGFPARPLAMYDGNGRITCAEARAHGIAPVHRGQPAYQYMRDADANSLETQRLLLAD